MPYGKIRTRSARIGAKGERIFSAWATDRGLAPNKTEEDYGIDFFCQVMRAAGRKGSEVPTGAILAVQVRATEKDNRPKIRLSKDDIGNLLEQKSASCVIAVDIRKGMLYYLFVDEETTEKFLKFLQSTNRGKLSLLISEMKTDPQEFDERLRTITKPGTQSRLNIIKAEHTLREAVPGSRIRITQQGQHGAAFVTVPLIGSAFSVQENSRELAREAFFDNKMNLHITGLLPRGEFFPVSELVDGDLWIRGPLGLPATLSIGCGDKLVIIENEFEMRCLGDEFAWVHPIGIGLVFSAVRKIDGQHVHVHQFRIFKSNMAFDKNSTIFAFLKQFRENAKIFPDAKEMGWPIERWGDNIKTIGPILDALEAICNKLVINISNYHLHECVEEEFLRTLGFLDAFLLQNVPAEGLVQGFVLGPSAKKEINEVPTKPVSLKVPLVMNLGDLGITVWIAGKGIAYLTDDGRYCGLAIHEQIGYEIEFSNQHTKSKYPEMCACKHWPPMEIREERDEVFSFQWTEKDLAYVKVDAIITEIE